MDNVSVSAEATLADLISLWQQYRAEGQTVTADELCRACPELLPELEHRIASLHRMGALADAHKTATRAPESRVRFDVDEASTLDPQATRWTPPPEQPTPATEVVTDGPVIPGYEVLSLLGKGGMGVVYKVRQRGLGRIVALKMILHAEYAGAQERQRFQAEAEAVARLQHANIVQIHEVGEHRGLPYFSLEFCGGGSLADKFGGTPLPPKEAAALVQKLALAMQAAHEKGILHRDLKPANILLTEDGTPKVTDFGLAKRLGAVTQTQSGAVMGTPSYMAPEQAGGKRKEIGPATDVYALGAILYELLTGRPPFKAGTSLDTILQVLEHQPAPPRLLNANINRELETICLKCLEKDPRHRYPSAKALAEDLQRYLNGEAISAQSYNLMDILTATLEHSHDDIQFRNYGTLLYWFAATVFLAELVANLVLQTRSMAFLTSIIHLVFISILLLQLGFYRRFRLRPATAAERQMWSIWLGYLGSCFVIGIAQQMLRLRDPTIQLANTVVYPALAAVSGLAFFALGSHYWGWCYVFGASFFGLSLLMTWDLRWTPIEYGTLWAALLGTIGTRLRRLGAAESAELNDNVPHPHY